MTKQNDRFSEANIERLLDTTLAMGTQTGRVAGWCQYEGDKPEQGYEILIWLAPGELRRCGRRDLAFLAPAWRP